MVGKRTYEILNHACNSLTELEYHYRAQKDGMGTSSENVTEMSESFLDFKV